MEQSYTRLLSQLKDVSPKDDLSIRIMQSIQTYEAKRARTQKTIWASLGSLSTLSSIWLILYTYSHLAQSGFYQYVSLIFSERTSLLVYAKDFGVVLLETLPIFATAALFLTLAGLVWSIKSFTEQRPFAFA